jgi:hypothetical protein
LASNTGAVAWHNHRAPVGRAPYRVEIFLRETFSSWTSLICSPLSRQLLGAFPQKVRERSPRDRRAFSFTHVSDYTTLRTISDGDGQINFPLLSMGLAQASPSFSQQASPSSGCL